MPVDYFWLLKEKKENITNAQTTPDRKKNKIMAHLTHSVSRNNAFVSLKLLI